MKKQLAILLVLLTVLTISSCTSISTNPIGDTSGSTHSGASLNPYWEITPHNYAEQTPDNTPDNLPEITTEPLPTVTVMPTTAVEYGLGDEDEQIVTIQIFLTELGYFHYEVTGYFGEKTEEAIKLFQSENGLPETGKADAETLAVLFSDDAKPCTLPLAGIIIGVDPGHQRHGNAEQEPVSPGSSETKKKVSSGTEGRYTHVAEYQVNLDVGLLLRDLLEEQGATVIMTRETNDVDISNVERAQLFNREKTDYALRLHCNGTDDPSVHGAFMLVPTDNPYQDDCERAARLLIDAFCEETGAKNRGITWRSDQTGFNWCERMIINIEMGHMTNKKEDYNLVDSDYQEKMAQGLLRGILEYYGID